MLLLIIFIGMVKRNDYITHISLSWSDRLFIGYKAIYKPTFQYLYIDNSQVQLTSSAMISHIISSSKVSRKTYYFVKWTDESQSPSWVTKDAFPQIRDLLIRAGLPVQEDREHASNRNSLLPSIVTESMPLFDFLKWKGEKGAHLSREKKMNYQTKLQREGVEKYELTVLQKLQLKLEQLTEQCERKSDNLCLDYQIDFIEGTFMSKTKQICFIVNIIGKNQKMSIPMDKMKKYFPKTLRNYLAELVKAHEQRENEGQVQSANEEEMIDQASSPHESRLPQQQSQGNPPSQAHNSVNKPNSIYSHHSPSQEQSSKRLIIEGNEPNSQAYDAAEKKNVWDWQFDRKEASVQQVENKRKSQRIDDYYPELSSSQQSSSDSQPQNGEADVTNPRL